MISAEIVAPLAGDFLHAGAGDLPFIDKGANDAHQGFPVAGQVKGLKLEVSLDMSAQGGEFQEPAHELDLVEHDLEEERGLPAARETAGGSPQGNTSAIARCLDGKVKVWPGGN